MASWLIVSHAAVTAGRIKKKYVVSVAAAANFQEGYSVLGIARAATAPDENMSKKDASDAAAAAWILILNLAA